MRNQLRSLLIALGLAFTLLAVPPVQSAVTIETDGEQTFNIGAALRTSFESVENAAPDGSSSKDFNINEAWILTNGQLLGESGSLESVNFTFNADINPAAGTAQEQEQLRLLDATIDFNFGNAHNIKVGRLLTPTSRANMDGPLFTGTWYFPGVLEIGTYPVAFAGRDDGIAYWGTVLDQALKYQVSAVEGFQPTGSNASDNLLYAGRVTYNVLDPEPAYVNASTYYGSKDILAFSAAYQMESGAFGNGAGDYSAYTLEALYEVPLANGHVPTVELSYQDYDKDGFGAVTGEGSGYYLVAGYKVSSFRPHVRYQEFEPEASGQANVERLDAGIDYLLNGHSGKITATYTDNRNNNQSSATQDAAFNLGFQFQI